MSHTPPDRAARDALIAACVVIAGGLLFTSLDAVEWLSPAVTRFEAFELDEILLTLALALVAAVWFALRRFRESQLRLASLRTAEHERTAYMRRLEELSRQLMSAEASERERIAILLHDAISQSLYAAQIRLDVLRKGLPERERSVLDDARSLVAAAMAQRRALPAELSPPALHDLGLADALEAMLSRMGARYGLDARLEPSSAWTRIEQGWNPLVYQAVQELVANAGKHARAREVVVSATPGPGRETRVHVRDDGGGFDVAARPSAGFGLLSIEQRLSRARATLELDSEHGLGTTATLRLPAAQS